MVQAVGQCIMEQTIYDEDGQLMSASFMDYRMPRAEDIPDLHFETRNVPSTTNALGMKGAGEAGTIGAGPAVMNAVVDALHREYGIEHIDMPATPFGGLGYDPGRRFQGLITHFRLAHCHHRPYRCASLIEVPIRAEEVIATNSLNLIRIVPAEGMGWRKARPSSMVMKLPNGLQRFRMTKPHVHCITNSVAQHFTANVLLAAGATPSHDNCSGGSWRLRANG